jgi:hypothetical protein
MSDSSKPKVQRGGTGRSRPETLSGPLGARGCDIRTSNHARRFQATSERRRNAGGVEAGGGVVNASTELSAHHCVDGFQVGFPSSASAKRPSYSGDRGQLGGSGQPTVFRKAGTPIARSWKLAAGGLAFAGTAMVGATFALMNRAPDLPKRELAVVATEGPVRPQSGGQTVEPSSSAGSLVRDGRPTEPSQVGALETRPDAMTAPARISLLPARGEAVADAPPQPASFGLESVAPAFTQAPANPVPAPVAPQTATQDGAPTSRAPSAPAATGSALPAARPKPHANATATAYGSAEAAQSSTPKIDSARKPPGKSSLQRPAKSAKASATPVAQAERRSPNEAESPPPAAQGVGDPTPVATPAPPTIQQRFADGLTRTFSYVVHLPGALLQRSADPNADANR